MTLKTTPATSAVATDANGRALGGGVNTADPTKVVTQRMVEDAGDPNTGAAEVVVVGGTGPVAKSLAYLNLAIVAAAAAGPVAALATPCAEVTIQNHDGADPNGNSDNVYVGWDASVDASHFAICLEPGGFYGFGVDDASKVFVFSPGNVTVAVGIYS